ncbi:XdhC/CoxI family protein [Rhodococcus sp. IEGM 1408]|uniref:XdhC family protein n=1 Tax=Rhodococcus sp. IEGM 1408 TaxID=3082220 RepID=UPI0029546E95|nr:XdhC/CoxI family protein [Rhodococcus sp. IEGM 1408]MDV8000678.1 XdhC/CoxI family protein [Rhodococcus sp. IEGM 1408]
MDLLLDAVHRWRLEGTRCALARVVHTERSAPLPPGAAMAVAETGEVIGGVSGGCVDGTVFSLCEQVIDDGIPLVAEFGGDDPSEFSEGPTCGGTSEVFVQRLDGAGHDAVERVRSALRRGEPMVLATAVTGRLRGAHLLVGPDGAEGTLGDPDLDRHIARLAAERLTTGHLGLPGARTVAVPVGEGARPTRVLLHSFAPPTLLIFGASAFGEALSRAGALLGYRVVVCDARPALNRPERFPDAHEVVTRWPHEYLESVSVGATTAICVLTHDHKFDIPLLRAALRSPAGFVGAMGSRRVHAERVAMLRAEGLTEPELARLSSPIGLDLGARTAEETAVSIVAELVARRRGGTGAPLTHLDVDIHR